MMFTIYHIFGRKVGCTIDFPGRCHDQGCEPGDYEIVETISEACGAKFASHQERFWQWYYGYREKPAPPYAVSADNARKLKLTDEQRREYGRRGGRRLAELGKTPFQLGIAQRSPKHPSQTGEFNRIGTAASALSPNRNSLQMIRCPHCGKEGRLPPMKRWHFDNCGEV